MIATGESCFAFQQRALLLLKLPLKKRNIVKKGKEIIKQLKVD